jgi:hypothetical protein
MHQLKSNHCYNFSRHPLEDQCQPDVGHEMLWVIRECISGEILLAKTSLSATQEDLAELLKG